MILCDGRAIHREEANRQVDCFPVEVIHLTD
jgi:hypothetical protein